MKFIKNNKIEPYYILLGDNELFKRDFINELVEEHLKEKLDPSSVYTYSFAEKNPDQGIEDAIEKASTPSFFSEMNLVVIKEFGKLKKAETERLFDFLEKKPGCAMIVLTHTINLNEKKNRGYRKKLNETYGVPVKRMIDFSSGNTQDIKNWAAAYVAEQGKKIDPEVLDFVVEESNNDAAAIKNELEKMLLFVGKKPEINKDDFSAIRGVDKDYDVWALTAAVGAADEEKTFRVLERIYDYSEPEKIMGAIFREVQKIYMVRFFLSVGKENRALKCVYNNPKALWAVKNNISKYKRAQYADIAGLFKDADRRVKLSDKNSAKTAIIMLLQKLFLMINKKSKV